MVASTFYYYIVKKGVLNPFQVSIYTDKSNPIIVWKERHINNVYDRLKVSVIKFCIHEG